ncbi:hypothetical protein AOL_s00088g61, partial [Orbilia oligospora ATCC 24927]
MPPSSDSLASTTTTTIINFPASTSSIPYAVTVQQDAVTITKTVTADPPEPEPIISPLPSPIRMLSLKQSQRVERLLPSQLMALQKPLILKNQASLHDMFH